MTDSMWGNSLNLSSKSMDHLWARQSVILNNIANNDTPGYKAKYVTFEDELRRQLNALSDGSAKKTGSVIGRSRYFVHDTNTESARADGNNVNTDTENVELVRTTLQYQYEVQAFNSDINRLRAAIKA